MALPTPLASPPPTPPRRWTNSHRCSGSFGGSRPWDARMHCVVCARYRDPVIRPSMDSLWFLGTGRGEKKKKDSNDQGCVLLFFFFFFFARPEGHVTMPRDSTIVRNKAVCDRAPITLFFTRFSFPYAFLFFHPWILKNESPLSG